MSPLRHSFEEFRLIYPPRARGAINPADVSRYEGWIAQYKYHDIRTLIYVFPDGSVELFNRHKRSHRAYQLTGGMKDDVRKLALAPGKFHVMDGGLMHAKTPRLRDRLILWDLLVHDSEYLIGTTYRERYGRLAQACGNPTEFERQTGDELALRVSEHVWFAHSFRGELALHYKRLIHLDEIEGLMLKNPQGRLEWGVRESNNGSWQLRVRKPHPNYTF